MIFFFLLTGITWGVWREYQCDFLSQAFTKTTVEYFVLSCKYFHFTSKHLQKNKNKKNMEQSMYFLDFPIFFRAAVTVLQKHFFSYNCFHFLYFANSHRVPVNYFSVEIMIHVLKFSTVWKPACWFSKWRPISTEHASAVWARTINHNSGQARKENTFIYLTK